MPTECCYTSHKDAEPSSTDIGTYFHNWYGLWLDFRSSDDGRLHNSGRQVEGITLQLKKTAKPAGLLNRYVFILMDAQMNIGSGRLISVAS